MITAILKIYFMDLNTKQISNRGEHVVHYTATLAELVDLINDKYKFDDVNIIEVMYKS